MRRCLGLRLRGIDMKFLSLPAVFVSALLLSGCMASTGGGIYRDRVDPVTGERTLQTTGVTFLTADQGIFSGLDTGVGLGGKIINGVPYFVIGYSGNNWLFLQRAEIRLEGSSAIYTLDMNDPTREVGSTARVYENQTIRADRGDARSLLEEIIRKSKLPKSSKIYIRAEGQDSFVSGVGTLKSGPKSFGAFFADRIQ